MKVSNLIKRLARYIETYGDMEVYFNIPRVANFSSCALVEDRDKCYLELESINAFSNSEELNCILDKYCN